MLSKWKVMALLLILILFSFVVRIYKIDSAPPSIQVDEVSYGYNAYSVLKTGADEHGVTLPLIFKAYGDQKLPAYAYSLIPSIKFFGLTNLAVRLPSVIAGTLLTVIMFFLLKEFGFSIFLSFIGAFIVATNPWNIILSRFGYESNLGLLFFVLGLLFALIGNNKNKIRYFVLSGLFLGLTWYSYVAYRLVTPFILLSFVYLFKENKKLINKQGVVLLVSFFIVILPIFSTLITPSGVARLQQTRYNTNEGIVLNVDENRTYCSQELPKLLCYSNANKIMSYFGIYLSRYINTYSPDYLFINGDQNLKYLNVDNFGLFYIILLPFYLIGMAYLWNKLVNHKLTKYEFLLIIGLFISPIPSVLAGDPQKVRLSALLPFIVILILYGLSAVENYLKTKINKNYFRLSLVGLLIIFNFYFMVNYLTVNIKKYQFQYGSYIPSLMKYLSEQDKNTQIYISSFTEAIEYYAFMNKVDPIIYQKQVVLAKPDAIGFAHATDLENIHTTSENINKIYCQSKINNTHSLFVTPENLQGSLGKAKKIIFSPDQVLTILFIYDVNDIVGTNIDCKFIMQ